MDKWLVRHEIPLIPSEEGTLGDPHAPGYVCAVGGMAGYWVGDHWQFLDLSLVRGATWYPDDLRLACTMDAAYRGPTPVWRGELARGLFYAWLTYQGLRGPLAQETWCGVDVPDGFSADPESFLWGNPEGQGS